MKKLLSFLFILLTCAGVASGQASTGQIFGQVTDASGALIPNVKVTLTSSALIQPMVANTSSSGTYQFPNIPVGMYSVQFDAASYRSSLHKDVRIDIGFNAEINGKLEVASETTTIDVSSAAPVVDTQSTAQSQELDQQALEGLPVARSTFNEVELAPGTSSSAKDVGGSQNLNQTLFSALGAIPGQNRYFYDGVDIAPAAGGNAIWVDFNSVQEMQVQSGGADATVQTSGMAINMVAKSGSDKFHGSFHEFEEGQTFESDNIGKGTPLRNVLSYVGASPGNALTHFRDIGGEIGGPIKKGRLWIWGDVGNNAISVAADKIYNTNSDCAAVAANQTAYDFKTVRSCEFSFPTYIKFYAYKLGWQVFHNNTFTLTNEYSVKQVIYNGLTPLVPLDTTRPQNSACGSHFHWGGLSDISSFTPGSQTGLLFWNCGWPVLWKFDDQQIISDRWLVDVAYMHFTKRNQFALQSPAQYNTAIELEQSSGAIENSNIAVMQFQPMNNFKVASSYTLPGKWGGNHNFKFGYNYYRFENCCTDNAGGAAEEIYNSAAGLAPFTTPTAVNFYRYGFEDQFLNENNAYLQDTYTHKNWTLNLGVRWDQQKDSEKGFTTPASPYEGQLGKYDASGVACHGGPTCVPFTYIPSATYPGAQDGVTWNTFAPRLGVTYDLRGKGTTVLKASFGQYFDQRSAGQLSDTYNTIGQGTVQSFLQLPWDGSKDANGNPLMSGVDTRFASILSVGGNYQKANAAGTSSPNKVDPGVRDPKTTEFTAGVSQQVSAGFGVTVTYTYRKFTDFIWNQLNGITSADFVKCTTSPTTATTCGGKAVKATTCPTTVAPMSPTQCVPVDYYVSSFALPTTYTVTNEPDYYRTYQGVSVVVRKSLAKRWSFDGNFTVQSNRQFWSASDAYQDPTNIAQQNGAQYSPTSAPGGGFPISVAVNARWNAKFGGTYKLPWWGIGLSAVDDVSQGYPYLSAISTGARANGNANIAVLVAPPGSQRLANVQNMNARIDKSFTFKDRIKALGSLDVYNLLNANTILGQQPNQNATNANYIDYILGPRVLRLGVKVSF